MAPPPSDDLAGALVEIFHTEGSNLTALGLAWARVAPAVALVPAFGLRASPVSFRIAMGLLLGASVAPALAASAPSGPWAGALVRALLSGIPVALGAALPIWIASMAGGVMDALRGASEGTSLPVLEGRQGAFGSLWGLLACLGFLVTGGPARVALAVLEPPTVSGVARVVLGLTSGVAVAVAIAAPMLAGAVLVEVAVALVARAATPASLAAVLGSGRNAILLLLSALFFDRIAALVLLLVQHAALLCWKAQGGLGDPVRNGGDGEHGGCGGIREMRGNTGNTGEYGWGEGRIVMRPYALPDIAHAV